MPWGAMFGGIAGVAAASLAIVLAPVVMPRAPVRDAPGPELTTAAAQASLHDQYDLASSLGTADGLFLSLPVRPKESTSVGLSRPVQSAN